MHLRAAHLNVIAMRRCLFIAVIHCSALLVVADTQEGPKNAVLLIIRHAENPANGHGLSHTGRKGPKRTESIF